MFLKIGKGLSPRKRNVGGVMMDTGAKTAAVFGDSISLATLQTTGGTQRTLESVSYFNCYNVLSRQRMYFPNANNLGSSGDTTAMMSARKTDLAALTFDVCFVLGGTNDIKMQYSAASAISNLGAIYDYITGTLGKTVIALTTLPRSNWTPLTGTDLTNAKADLITINNWIMAQHGTRSGRVFSVDIYTNFNGGNNEPYANATYDGLHPSPYGGMINGIDICNRLAPYFGNLNLPNFTTGNLLSNGTITGTGGTPSTNFTGTVATGYSAAGGGGTGGRTASKNGDGSQRLNMAVTGGGTSDSARLIQSITTGFTVGDTVYAQALVQISGTPVNIYGNSLQLRLSGTGIPTLANAYGFDKRNNDNWLPEQYMTVTPGKYLLQTPDLVLSSGSAMTLEWRYEMLGNSSISPTSGVVDIYGAGIYKR